MKIHKEIEKSFPIIENFFTQNSLLVFKNTPKEDLYLYHFELGTWIRNKLLYPNSQLTEMFHDSYIHHPDDMSDLIIKEFHDWLIHKI